MGGDIRVSSNGEHDALMEEVGEKTRPPGEPPDNPGTWASKVSGSNAGGRPAPEEVVEEAFVEARMRLEFPDGEDGEPVLLVDREVITAMHGLMKRCMIVKVLGRNIALPVLSRKLRELWKPQGSMHVVDLPRQFFVVRFEKEEEFMMALTGGPWKAFGSYLMVQAWSPEFDPLKHQITTTPVWARISNIPLHLYHKTLMMGMAKGLGNPIKVDLSTLHYERARFARVCVEVNLKKPLKGTIRINEDRYFVSYEGLSNICALCGLYGHLVHKCPNGRQEKHVEKDQGVSDYAGGQRKEQEGDGFTQVRRNGRHSGSQPRLAVPASGPVRVERVNQLRDPRKKKDTGNSRVSNSFGMLGGNKESGESSMEEAGKEVVNVGENMEISEIREAVSSHERKKEIMDSSHNSRKENMATIKKVGPVEESGGLENNINMVFEFGEMDRGNGRGVGRNNYKPKKNRGNVSTKGLVYGPIGGEQEFSVSGKRQRMDRESIGRSGASFINNLINSGSRTEKRMEEGNAVSSSNNAQDKMETVSELGGVENVEVLSS